MKVLHILWSGRVGGKERAVYQLVRSQLRCSSEAVPAIAFGQAEGHYVQKFRELGCEVVDFGLKSGRSVCSVPRLRKALNDFEAHHFHSAEPPIMLASVLCAHRKRFYTHRAGAAPAGLKKRASYKVTSFFLRHYFMGLSANTRHAAEMAAQGTGIVADVWQVTYNGMDFALLDPGISGSEVRRAHSLPAGRVIIGTSAHIRAWKRIDMLLEAYAGLERRIREEAHLLIVGDGPDRLRLERLSLELEIKENVTFAGMQREVGPYLAVMDIYALPSNSQESFGNAVVEAMSAGLPCIVFEDGGGLLEHVRHEKSGYVVKTLQDFTTRLSWLIRNADLRRSMGAQASEYVRKTYSLEEMVAGYDRFYHDSKMRNPHSL